MKLLIRLIKYLCIKAYIAHKNSEPVHTRAGVDQDNRHKELHYHANTIGKSPVSLLNNLSCKFQMLTMTPDHLRALSCVSLCLQYI